MPRPATLAALGDLYSRIGEKGLAQRQYDTVELIARLAAMNELAYGRELALFYADHDIKLVEALELATNELAVRNDIYGYDALAWALYKNDRPEEAAAAIAKAMELGTKDANLYFHAGMIHYDLGDRELARRYLEQALELNPHFSILHEDAARQTLHELRAGRASNPAARGITR